jgi:Neu-associated kinase
MKYIYKKGKLEEPETRKFMRQIVSAVDHLHRAGIIHR